MQVRLPLLIALAFAVTTLLVVLIVEQKMAAVINQSQNLEYGEKLQTVVRAVHNNFDRLQKTRMVATYEDDFQHLTLRQLSETYERADEKVAQLFILDAQGHLLLPAILPATNSLFPPRLADQLRQSETNSLTFTLQTQEQVWCIYRNFTPWGWTIGYLVPHTIRYHLLYELNRTLIAVIGGITLSIVILLLWLVRRQLKPILQLTKISAEMAEGNLDRRIKVERDDEIGLLANHFNRMQTTMANTIASLRLSEEKLRTTLDSIGDAVIATNEQGLISRMNPVAEKLTGWSIQEARGIPLQEVFSIIHAKTREPLAGQFQQILDSRRAITLEDDTILLAKNGTEHLVADSAAPILHTDNRLSGMVLVFRDITEERAIQEQLLQSRKMETIGQLAGGIAHDFNNMLGGILGAAELIKPLLGSDPAAHRFLAMIIESGERAADLTAKLLAFARKQPIMSTAVDVHLALRNALALLESTLDRRIRITTELAAPNSMVVGDLGQLQNIFLNLAINAAQAMPAGGDIIISSKVRQLDEAECQGSGFQLQPGRFIDIELRDNGCGIAQDNLERIFEPFFTTKQHGAGTGLGLAAVFGTVQVHHGAVSVASEVGVGTTFHVLLPLSEIASVTTRTVQEATHGSGLILVIDDEDVIRATATAILQNLGYDVMLAENGRRGLELFRQHWQEIDLVLLDMVMPEMNGRDCFFKMKEISADVRVVLSSGFAKHTELANLRTAGLAGFIRKPYRSTELSRIVSAALDDKTQADFSWAEST